MRSRNPNRYLSDGSCQLGAGRWPTNRPTAGIGLASTCCFARGRDKTGPETSVVSRLGGTIGWGLGANWAFDMEVAVRSLAGKLRDLQRGCGGKGLREGCLRRRGSV